MKDFVVVAAWDANTSLGDTVMEKWEFLYVKLVEVSNALIAKGADKEGMTIIAGRSIALALDCFHTSPPAWETQTGKFDMGMLNNRWRLFLDDGIPNDRLIIDSNKGKVGLLIANLKI